MVASVDRVSHVNGWSFHSDLPGLTRDANVDFAQLLPAAVRAGHDLSSHGSRRNTNLFAAVFWQAISSSLALLSPTLQVKSSSSSSLCDTCEHGGRAIENDGQRVRPCVEACLSRRRLDSYHYGKQSGHKESVRSRARWQVFTFVCSNAQRSAAVSCYGTDCGRAFSRHTVPFGFLQPRHGRGCTNRNGTVWRAKARSQSVP